MSEIAPETYPEPVIEPVTVTTATVPPVDAAPNADESGHDGDLHGGQDY